MRLGALLTAVLLLSALALPGAGDPSLPDPLRSQQYGLDLIDAPEAWSTATGEGVRVAVLDTGIDHGHLDLATQTAHTEGQSVAEPYGTYATLPAGPWNTTQDTDGHGTLVAGVLAAERGNGVGIAGTSDATLIAIKLDDLGVLSVAEFIAEGIRAAIQAEADVVQISQSTATSTHALDAALAEAEDAGLVVVAAAGNQGADEPRWPAAASTAVAVGAVDTSAQAWSLSNEQPALVAPGVDVLSTYLANTYQEATGTSLAAPFVSGTAALVLDACPSTSPHELRATLNQTAADLGSAGYDASTGWGLVQADQAVQQAQADCA